MDGVLRFQVLTPYCFCAIAIQKEGIEPREVSGPSLAEHSGSSARVPEASPQPVHRCPSSERAAAADGEASSLPSRTTPALPGNVPGAYTP